MKHLDVNKTLKRTLKGNATGFNMLGLDKNTSSQSETSIHSSSILKRSDYVFGKNLVLSPTVTVQGRIFNHAFVPTVVKQKTPPSQLCLQKEDSPLMNPTTSLIGTVVLSSDEEETGTLAPTRMNHSSPEMANSFPSTSGGSIEIVKDDDVISDYFDNNPSRKIRLPRKMLMKDPLGKVVPKKLSAKRRKGKQDNPLSPPSKKKLGAISEVSLRCRLVRVGTMHRTVEKPVTVTTENIKIDNQVSVQTLSVASSELCLSKMLPSLLLKTTPAECVRLRSLLKMSHNNGVSWFDSKGPNLGENYIILVFESLLADQDQVLLEDILSEIGRVNRVVGFIREISFEEAKQILMHGQEDSTEDKSRSCRPSSLLPEYSVSSPKTSASLSFPLRSSVTFQLPSSSVQQEVSELVSYPPKLTFRFPPQCAVSQNRTSELSLCPRKQKLSPAHLSDSNDDDNDIMEVIPAFSSPVKRLILYPPPPARGSISVTNEDLHCLNEGVFLNDVIIDFYLKYLVLAELRDEDAERSYMFSSFFYRRLTQTQKGQVQGSENQPKKMVRHDRVRTWTRNVDLFQKDFIFVPINESAHWFLAVICFPGLDGPVWSSPGCLSRLQLEEDKGEPISPALRETESFLNQALLSRLSPPSPNPMSLFFSPMKSASNSSLHPSTGPESLPDVDLTIGIRMSVSSDLKEEDLRTGMTELSVSSSTTSFRQRSGQQHHTDRMQDCVVVSPKAAMCRTPCILILDSLAGHSRLEVVKILQEYLEAEWELRKGTKRSFSRDTMRGSCPQVPQQDNFSDCGVYLLQYVESFFQNPPQSFEQPMDLSDWFPLKQVKNKRAEIKKLILKLHLQQEKKSSVT